MPEIDLSAAVGAVHEMLASSDVPALALGITDRERLLSLILHGYSDLKARVPLTAASRFAIGSVTKCFTGIASMQLAMEGQFDLHAPIKRYLPSLSISSPFAAMTGHHLLTHTSGLPNYLVNAASSKYALEALRDFTPSYAPGEHVWYSNTGYQLLGYILENIERQPYQQIIQRRVLGPLDMRCTSSAINDSQRAHMVTSYIRWPYNDAWAEAPWFEFVSGDGSLVSAAPDMCAFARFMLNRGATRSEVLLPEPTLAEFTAPHTERDEVGRTCITYGGAIAGYRCFLQAYIEDGVGLVILCNGMLGAEFRRSIAAVVTAAFRATDVTAVPVPQKRAKLRVEDYAGVYHPGHMLEGEAARELEFAVMDGCLQLKRGDQLLRMERMGVDCFRVAGNEGSEFPYFFARDQSGAGATIVEMSHGRRWYVTKAFTGTVNPPAPPEYSAYVGHYEYGGPEGPSIRIFIRNGRLWALDLTAMYMTEQPGLTPLEPVGVALFRCGEEEYSPERIQFDTVVEGVALRMMYSGTSLFRKDTP